MDFQVLAELVLAQGDKYDSQYSQDSYEVREEHRADSASEGESPDLSPQGENAADDGDYPDDDQRNAKQADEPGEPEKLTEGTGDCNKGNADDYL